MNHRKRTETIATMLIHELHWDGQYTRMRSDNNHAEIEFKIEQGAIDIKHFNQTSLLGRRNGPIPDCKL
jgi:hypothetical protein